MELFAVVELRSSHEMLILTVRNLSVGGVLVSDDGNDLSEFPVGTKHELAIFTPGDTQRQLVIEGQVVRHQQGAMALTWNDDDAAMMKLRAWLGQQ